jgi:anaerobic magnesium-protoporphyrin IX monomethyl ester cyclase
MTREAGIGVLASFVLGLPGETPQTLRQTLEFADSLGVPYSLNLLTPYVGTEIRERAAEWGVKILSNDWRYYGQGFPLTSTPTVGPWHLRRAVNQYRRGLRRYLEDLLEGEHRGTLSKENAGALHRHRHWNFLRRLIGEEVLEGCGSLPDGSDGNSAGRLAKALAPQLGMTADEVRQHLEPHLRDGHISPAAGPKGSRWAWA